MNNNYWESCGSYTDINFEKSNEGCFLVRPEGFGFVARARAICKLKENERLSA